MQLLWYALLHYKSPVEDLSHHLAMKMRPQNRNGNFQLNVPAEYCVSCYNMVYFIL